MIDRKTEAILLSKDHKTLAHWACELNAWKWPEEIPDEESISLPLSSMPRRMGLIHWIEVHVGKKEVLRTHWERQRFDLDDFDEFWHANYESGNECDTEAYQEKCRQKYVDQTNRLSLTGHPRSYYKDLQEKKEKELGTRLHGSVGFFKRQLLSSVEWINTFDEKESFGSIEEIISVYEREYRRIGLRIIQIENDGEELRIWFRNEMENDVQ